MSADDEEFELISAEDAPIELAEMYLVHDVKASFDLP